MRTVLVRLDTEHQLNPLGERLVRVRVRVRARVGARVGVGVRVRVRVSSPSIVP